MEMLYVLIFQLQPGGPLVTMPVRECREMKVWVLAARDWAERSGLVPDESVACYRADDPYVVRVRYERR